MGNLQTKWQLKLLRIFCNESYLEEIEGDLLESFDKRANEGRPAYWLLWVDILKLIRPNLFKPFYKSQKLNSMLKHNIKVSFRSFKRNRTSFLINYVGLVGGLVTVLFIYLWVNHELSVDQFHSDGNRIYRLVSDNGGNATLLNTNPIYAKELEASIPEIEYVVNSAWGSLVSNLIVDDEAFAMTGEFATEGFFDLFSYPLISGNSATVFNEPNAILLSEETALKLFESTDVIGQRLEWRWFSLEEPVIIAGIYKDLPTISSEQFDYVLNFKVYEKRMGERVNRGRQGRTFLKLTEGASPEIVNKKIYEHTRATFPDYEGDPYFVIQYADYYLRSEYENGKPIGGRIELVRLFSAIGILILVIACVNFMNLSTARAALRTKEIGVRKTMGALRRSLIAQFLTEACMVSLLAGISSIVILFVLFPFFQQLLEQQISIVFDLKMILTFLSIILFTGIISGSYPALYLSNFSPLKVLKGPFAASVKDQWFRKGLVVFQFGTSLILIVAVLVIYQQMQFVQNKSLGYEQESIINFQTTGMNGERQQAFLSEVRKLSGVVKASGISHALFGSQRSGANISWDGKDPEQEVWFEYGNVGYDMLELLEIQLLDGRFFSRDFGNEQNKVVINRATRDLLGDEDVIGRKFSVSDREYEIIGVTDDFHFQSLHQEIKPTFFLLSSSGWNLRLALKIESKTLNQTLAEVDEVYSKFNPGFSFEYTFHDQDRAEMYASDDKVGLLTKYAAGLAILISSLGLFGLVSFVTERKSKEMGIRKVLGASSSSIIHVISKDFMGPISIASVLGVAISGVLISNWLDEFAYRIELKWWFFVGAILLMVLIALLTSISQILKAVMENPIETLRDE